MNIALPQAIVSLHLRAPSPMKRHCSAIGLKLPASTTSARISLLRSPEAEYSAQNTSILRASIIGMMTDGAATLPISAAEADAAETDAAETDATEADAAEAEAAEADATDADAAETDAAETGAPEPYTAPNLARASFPPEMASAPIEARTSNELTLRSLAPVPKQRPLAVLKPTLSPVYDPGPSLMHTASRAEALIPASRSTSSQKTAVIEAWARCIPVLPSALTTVSLRLELTTFPSTANATLHRAVEVSIDKILAIDK